jgi:hypothetical protein
VFCGTNTVTVLTAQWNWVALTLYVRESKQHTLASAGRITSGLSAVFKNVRPHLRNGPLSQEGRHLRKVPRNDRVPR